MTMEAIAKHDFNATADDELSFRQDHWKDYCGRTFFTIAGGRKYKCRSLLFIFVCTELGGEGGNI